MQDEVAVLKGATADSAAMVAVEPLLVNGGAGEDDVTSLVQDIESVLTSEIIFLLDIVDDSGGIVFQICWHDRFGTIDHEERGEASRSVDRSLDSPKDRGQLLDPATRSSL
jgi:hypothetical protein